jgi:3-oxoacyl-[acyl-carrier protein] reductase
MSDSTLPVLLLGSHGDIGTAIGARFAAAGHPVTALGRADLDLGQPATIDAWFARNKIAHGVLVHSAGLNVPKRFAELTQEEIEQSFEVNVNGFLRALRHALPGLIAARGRIVVISSLYGFLARAARLPYVMSKHALIGIVKTLALELGPDGVLVNAVSPGYVDTRMTRKNNDAATIAKLVSHIPLGHMARAEDIAEAAYFLGSGANRYITGHDLVVDGGFSVDGGRN